jgi:tRNA(Ile)-lysidine synthase
MGTTKINLVDMKAFADQHGLLPFHTRIIIGLSGGADSVFLLHALHELKNERHLTLIAAHLNHEWRGAAADADEQFCREISESLGIVFVSKKMSALDHAPIYNGSREAVGRAARRFFLESVRAGYQADVIAVAHHAQDQVETFFIRLIRGASLTGLVGMRPRSGFYIRPLLSLSSQYVRAELARVGIAYVDDCSNESSAFLRNRIRKTVISALRACDNRFDAHVEHAMQRLAQTEEYLAECAVTLFAQMSEQRTDGRWINLTLLRTQPVVMQHRLLVHWLCAEQVQFTPTERFLDELLRFLHSCRGGTHAVHAQWRLCKKQQHASVQKI